MKFLLPQVHCICHSESCIYCFCHLMYFLRGNVDTIFVIANAIKNYEVTRGKV